MKLRSMLLLTAAIGVGVSPAAQAAAKKKHHPVQRHHASSTPSATKALTDEVQALRAEVEALKSRLDTQVASQQTVQEQVAAAATQAQAAKQQADATQAQVAMVPAKIDTAIEKTHHADRFYMKGITITPGGFLELAGIYRQHYMTQDMPTSFQNIPFPNTRSAHISEGRFSARQSRVSLLVEGVVSPKLKLSMYNELDFLGAAQTANSNESNSYNPRIRNIYLTADWTNGNGGIHLLAGQNWSLVTLNQKGITPRNELTPPQIDAQYVPGFVWARQPQIRLTADMLDHHLWAAVSVENPQTTTGGTVPSNVLGNLTGSGGFNSLVSPSFNHMPDVVGKVAYEAAPGGHALHIEAFGIYREFTERLTSANSNVTRSGGGVGGGITLQVVPKVLDIQFSGITGRGLGRYGASQLPDVTFEANGVVRPLKETMLLAGATLHATPKLDIYGFAGEEYVSRVEDYGSVGGTIYGYGSALLNNSGCLVEGGTCTGNTRIVRQATIGFWDKMYQGSFGRFQAGIQYSYTERQLFNAVGGAPTANQSIGFLSFRYYPF